MADETKKEAAEAPKPVGAAYVSMLADMRVFYNAQRKELRQKIATLLAKQTEKTQESLQEATALGLELGNIDRILSDDYGASVSEPVITGYDKALRAGDGWTPRVEDQNFLTTRLEYINSRLSDARLLIPDSRPPAYYPFASADEKIRLRFEKQRLKAIQESLDAENKKRAEQNDQIGLFFDANWPYMALFLLGVGVASLLFAYVGLAAGLTAVAAFLAGAPVISFINDMLDPKEKSLGWSAVKAFAPILVAGVLFGIILLGGGAPIYMAAAIAVSFLFITYMLGMLSLKFLGNDTSRLAKAAIGGVLALVIAGVVTALSGKMLIVGGLLLGSTLATGPILIIAAGLLVLAIIALAFLYQAAFGEDKKTVAKVGSPEVAEKKGVTVTSEAEYANTDKFELQTEKTKAVLGLTEQLMPYFELQALKGKQKELNQEVDALGKNIQKNGQAVDDLYQQLVLQDNHGNNLRAPTTLLSTKSHIKYINELLSRSPAPTGKRKQELETAFTTLSRMEADMERKAQITLELAEVMGKIPGAENVLARRPIPESGPLQQYAALGAEIHDANAPANNRQNVPPSAALLAYYANQGKKLDRASRALDEVLASLPTQNAGNPYAQFPGDGQGGMPGPQHGAVSGVGQGGAPAAQQQSQQSQQAQAWQQGFDAANKQRSAVQPGGGAPVHGGRVGG